jgi:hypothetical protein
MQKLPRLFHVSVGLGIILTPLQTRAQLNVALDFGTFRYDTSTTYTEIYYSIPISQLKFAETGSRAKQAQVMVRLNISKDGVNWREEAWRMEKTVADTATVPQGNSMMDILRYLMEPGAYHFAVYVEDLNDARNFQKVEKDLTIAGFPGQRLSLSDIQFAGSIKKAPGDSGNIFYKNGLEVIPAPNAVYGKESPMLYYYLEAYNLAKTVTGDTYKTRCRITDSDGLALAALKPREQMRFTPANLLR